MNDLMIDLETLGKRAGCVVLSIGACLFDLEGDCVGPTFETYISISDSLKAGLTIDPETLGWWLAPEQAEAARVVLPKAAASTISPAQAFNSGLVGWLMQQGVNNFPALNVWSNGANFDLPILGAMAAAVGAQAPWKFWNERCHRTMLNWFRQTSGLPTVKPAALKHSAALDADYQARALVAAWQRHNDKLSQYAWKDLPSPEPANPVAMTDGYVLSKELRDPCPTGVPHAAQALAEMVPQTPSQKYVDGLTGGLTGVF